MSYIAGLTFVTAIVGSMINYLYTGERPQGIVDMFYPRTGNTDDKGRPERLSLPTYAKDVVAYIKNPTETFHHKTRPLTGVVWDMLANEDFYGGEIRHKDDPIMQQLLDVATYVG